ncbi:MAG: hypothetical protein AAGA54_08960 [Myxococcota bacterium]
MRARWLLALVIAPLGCGDITSEVAIGFERPRDDGPLSGTNNVTITLSPDGFTDQSAVDGPDASLEVQLPPDDVSRTLEVFFARNETLLAYGRTPPFTFAGAAGAGVIVFLGYPGTLATLDRDFDLPDASTVIAPSPGRGAVALGSDGSAAFFDGYTFDFVTLAPYPDVPPAADDGIMVGDASGSVTRLSIVEQTAVARYVYGTDSWVTDTLDDAPPRPGAGLWYDDLDARIYVAGGGTQTDVLRVDVLPESGSLPVFTVESLTLDGPRVGAALHGIDTEGAQALMVVGGDDPALPLVLDLGTGTGYGERDGAWTGLRCVDLAEQETLCGGGTRDAAPTADAVRIDRRATPWDVQVEVDLLTLPMRDVLWLEDTAAVYAQGEGRLVRLDRATLEGSEPAGAPVRAVGGGLATMPTGVTIVAGGEDAEGAATRVWQVFSPDLTPG